MKDNRSKIIIITPFIKNYKNELKTICKTIK